MLLSRQLSVLILGLVAMACGGPHKAGGSVDVDFLWVKKSGVNPKALEGGTSPATIKVELSDSGMHVGVFESKPGGTGDMWRAAMWVAALTGTLNVQHNPLDYRYSVETQTLLGRVDGPSAGGLFAVAIMAALTGNVIRSDATMTGSVNPDGSVGPVGGIAQKLAAAGKSGKKRFCFPVGQRFEEDPLTGKNVDIQALAEKAGMEVVEVEDLSQAFLCLTDKKAINVDAVRRSQMSLSSAAFDLFKKKSDLWLKRCQEAYTQSQKLEKNETLDRMWTIATDDYDDADALLKEGLVAAAYWKAVTAYVTARTTLLSAAMLGMMKKNPAEALRIFETVEKDAKKTLDEVFAALAAVAPQNISQVTAMLDAYEAAITSLVSREFARMQYVQIQLQLRQTIKKGGDAKELLALLASLYRPLSELALVEVNAQMALDNLELMKLQEKSRKTRLARVDDIAGLFQGAASANIEYFDSIFVREVAGRVGKPEEMVSAVLLEKEPNYRTAQFNLKLPDSGKMEYAKEGIPSSMAKLAGALSSFFASSTLVAKFYSIGIKFDKAGNSVGVEREKALISTLALAEEKARENAAMAEKFAGEIPESARIAYQIGMVLRDRTSYIDKLDALEHFWRSSVWSQVAVHLARVEQ